MRLSAAVGIITAAVVGLLTYELAIVIGVTVAIGIGLVNLVLIGRQARAIKQLQESQEQRIDRLPPPPAG